MKVRVPMMVQDPLTARYKEIEPIEGVDITTEEYHLDGPVTRRVAILDFDPDTGALLPGVPFRRPRNENGFGCYRVSAAQANSCQQAASSINAAALSDPREMYTPEFIKTSVFATVMKT